MGRDIVTEKGSEEEKEIGPVGGWVGGSRRAREREAEPTRVEVVSLVLCVDATKRRTNLSQEPNASR